MISISDSAKQNMINYRGEWIINLAFTLSSGESLTISKANIWQGSFSLEDSVGQSGSFPLGTTCVNQMKVTIWDDGTYSQKNFLNATVVAKVGVHTGTVDKGYFTIVDAQRSGGLIELTGYDYMDKFSRLYKNSTRTYPCTLKQIVAEACTFCGVTDATGNFAHYNQSIANKPDDDTLTFREIIGYVAQMTGYNARVARNGRLQFIKYNLSGFDTEGAYHNITEVYSDRIEEDVITITGIHVDEENTVVTTDSEGIQTTSLVTTGYDAGSEGYVISISGNPLIKSGLGESVASWLYTDFGAKPFRIGTVTHSSDFTIEAGDLMKVTDRTGTYNMLVASTRFSDSAAQTTESYSASPRTDEVVQYSNIDKIKTVASEAHIVAMAAQGYANEAQRSANAAQASADDAADAAQTAWNHADDANDAAQTAWNRAGDALTAANNAQTSANNAATAASNAQTSANNAQTSANNAQTQAELATGYADHALIQLSEVEQVANILNWIAEHGTYSRTSDATIVQNKNYYTKSGDVYTLVTDPQQSDIGNYYELHIDEALSNYVSTHLALTNDGLYVIKDSNGYRLKLTNTSLQVIDADGNVVANYGTNITYDSTRPHTIGNNNNYIRFYDSDNDGVADSIAMIADQITIGSKSVGDAIDNLENMEIGGRNLIWNTNTPDPTNSQTRPNINGHWEGVGYMASPNTSQATTVAAEHGLKTTAVIQYAPFFYFGYSGSNQQYIQEASGCFGLKPGKTYTWSADIKCKMLSAQTATATRHLGMYFYYRTADNTSLVLEEYKYVIDYPVAEHGTEKSVHGALTFTVPSDADSIRLVCRCDQQTASWFAVGDYLEMSNVKLEEGNKATAWTPAPEDIDESIANNANEQDSLKKFIYGDTVYYYTTGGTTYEVRYNEADGQYHYTYEDDGESYDAVVAYADLDKNSSTGEVITTTENGLQGQVEELVGAIDIDPVEPSITLRTTGSQGGTDNASLKISDSKLSFSRRGEEVAYIESTGDDDVSVLDIVNARVHNSLRIGKLEIFEHNDGIGIRRWD